MELTQLYKDLSDYGAMALWLFSGAASIRFLAYYIASRDWGALFMFLMSSSVFLHYSRVTANYVLNIDGLGFGTLACVITTWLIVGVFIYIVAMQVTNEWTKWTNGHKGGAAHD